MRPSLKQSNSNEDFVLEFLRFKEHGIEQDVPVCEMVTQRKCNGVLGERQNILRLNMLQSINAMITSVPVPNEEGDEANRLRRQAVEGGRLT